MLFFERASGVSSSVEEGGVRHSRARETRASPLHYGNDIETIVVGGGEEEEKRRRRDVKGSEVVLMQSNKERSMQSIGSPRKRSVFAADADVAATKAAIRSCILPLWPLGTHRAPPAASLDGGAAGMTDETVKRRGKAKAHAMLTPFFLFSNGRGGSATAEEEAKEEWHAARGSEERENGCLNRSFAFMLFSLYFLLCQGRSEFAKSCFGLSDKAEKRTLSVNKEEDRRSSCSSFGLFSPLDESILEMLLNLCPLPRFSSAKTMYRRRRIRCRRSEKLV
jgi:hypothetical protein